MKTIIDWKPSDLPINTIISTVGDGKLIRKEAYRGVRGKEIPPHWVTIEIDNGWSVEDHELKDFEIISVPAEWYEEFRPVLSGLYQVNRAGWVRTGHNIPNGTRIIPDQTTIRIGKLEISVKTAVRKAFA